MIVNNELNYFLRVAGFFSGSDQHSSAPAAGAAAPAAGAGAGMMRTTAAWGVGIIYCVTA